MHEPKVSSHRSRSSQTPGTRRADRRQLPPGLQGPRRHAGPVRRLYDRNSEPSRAGAEERSGAAPKGPPLLVLGVLLAKVREAQDLIKLLADSTEHVMRSATVLMLLVFLSIPVSVRTRRFLLVAFLACAVGWAALAAGHDEDSGGSSRPTDTAEHEKPVGRHVTLEHPGPAAGNSRRWRIVGARTIRRVTAADLPVGPPIRTPQRAHGLAVCGSNLFVTYGDAWIGKFSALSGKALGSYRYRLRRPATPVACAAGSVFLPLAAEGTVVRLTQAELRFETRLAVGLHTSAPVFVGRELFAADRENNRVIGIDLSSNTLSKRFDVPDEPTSLALTSEGIAVLFRRGATVGLLKPSSGRIARIGRLSSWDSPRLAAVGDLVIVVHAGSPTLELFDAFESRCGSLTLDPAIGFSDVALRPDVRTFEAVDPSGRIVVIGVREAERELRLRETCRR
jgi:hypothetical protein